MNIKDPTEHVTVSLTRSEWRKVSLACSGEASRESQRRASRLRQPAADREESKDFEAALRRIANRLATLCLVGLLVVVGGGCAHHSDHAHAHPIVESWEGRCHHSRWYQWLWGGEANLAYCEALRIQGKTPVGPEVDDAGAR